MVSFCSGEMARLVMTTIKGILSWKGLASCNEGVTEAPTKIVIESVMYGYTDLDCAPPYMYG